MKNPRLFWTSLALARGTGLSGIESSSWHLEACILKVPRWNSFWTQLFSDLAARQSSSMHLAAWLARWDLAASPSRWASSFNLKIWHIEKIFSSLLPRFPWLTRRIALKMVRCHLLAALESKLLIYMLRIKALSFLCAMWHDSFNFSQVAEYLLPLQLGEG